jgi:hypothetical protein
MTGVISFIEYCLSTSSLSDDSAKNLKEIWDKSIIKAREQGKKEGLKVIKDAWNDWNKHHINYIEFIAILKKELGEKNG